MNNERKYSNKFAGWCYRCKGRVRERQGLTFKSQGKWFVEHSGECPEKAGPERGEGYRRGGAVQAREPQAPKANQYGGRCVNCNVFVPEKAGKIVKTNAGWKAAHLDAAACESAAAAAQEAPAAPRADRKTYAIPTGYYAIWSRTGNNDLDFFRVKTPLKGKWVGYSFAERVIGGQGPTPIGKAEQIAALDGIEAWGADVAGKSYADAIGNCFKCNKILTDEESRERGIGPVCFRKVQKLAAQNVAVAA